MYCWQSRGGIDLEEALGWSYVCTWMLGNMGQVGSVVYYVVHMYRVLVNNIYKFYETVPGGQGLARGEEIGLATQARTLESIR